MKIKHVYAVFFSPAGSTENITVAIAKNLSKALGVPMNIIDFTLPKNRQFDGEIKKYLFNSDDLVIFGTPTYAGRVPNKVLPFVQNMFIGNNTPAVSIVTFGNRSFDSSLVELKHELSLNGFHIFGAGAFVCRHVFSDQLATDRPDNKDMAEIDYFATGLFNKLQNTDATAELSVTEITESEEIKPYYTPLGTDMKPAKFLKAVPKTNMDKCDNCRVCAEVCPMGSIDMTDVSKINGICIKCFACILRCHSKAKYFDDENLLSHIKMLETNYKSRNSNHIFL